MDAQEILSRIKQQDKETFRRLVTEYGKGLYLKLYAASGDSDAARRATKAAFTELYLALNSQQSPDVIESLLYSIGERKQREILQEQTMKLTSECLAQVVELPAEPVIKELKTENVKPIQPVIVEETVCGEETANQTAGDIPVVVQKEEPAQKGMGFWQVVFALLVMAGLWVAVGALMGDGYLPKYDLGYRWFNMNIANWFTWL
ncbi:MAG: hypothetical protein IJN83_06135 [Clostridia bacterium]|nr:hypothetical protein [Clostridia bacterium]